MKRGRAREREMHREGEEMGVFNFLISLGDFFVILVRFITPENWDSVKLLSLVLLALNEN